MKVHLKRRWVVAGLLALTFTFGAFALANSLTVFSFGIFAGTAPRPNPDPPCQATVTYDTELWPQGTDPAGTPAGVPPGNGEVVISKVHVQAAVSSTSNDPGPCAGKHVKVILNGLAAPYPAPLPTMILSAAGTADWTLYDPVGPPVIDPPAPIAPVVTFTVPSAIIW